ncbi:hypothetical protein AWM75_05510 [Aerococcus urinaehominis]|uniref:Uncharacterized protein n=1 Tax=Aerococcus urinaehominis TaxID=128944 RepID=A0A0X8FLW0_9LACT|nr:hypothetical protein [Aerococcus urinaehominis]AMB99484.1 hypothetical protein AWM75_05510 [Aerococcus urinaehominis]SDM26830.1 hypothetical protein SAMN04487985_11043 [Aerococcus urinaehominis]
MKKRFGFWVICLRQIARLFVPRISFNPADYPQLDLNRPTVFVTHHENLKGPLRIIIWTPIFMRTWVFAKLVDQKTCYRHFSRFTFSKRFGLPLWLAKTIAWPTSWITAFTLKQARVIPVYRKNKEIKQTFATSLEALSQGVPILIMPDVDYANDTDQVGKIYEGFLAIDRLYQKRFKDHIQFVPIYANKNLRKMQVGKVHAFTGELSFRKEARIVAQKLRQDLNRLIDTDQEDPAKEKKVLSKD